ncbi:MAG: GAF domain-containing protein [Elusimicrobia bacterium]|nr:GAF domain-containing protein [Elusimicrobiota bacterium]
MKTPLSGGYLEALYDVLEFLSQVRETDEERVWSRVLEKLSVALDAEASTYFLYLPRDRKLIARYSLGVSADRLGELPIAMGEGVCGWVAKHHEAIIIEDAYKDSRFLSKADEITGFKTRNILAVPLMDRLDLSGVVELLNKRQGCFSAEDMRFAEAACRLSLVLLRSLRFEAMVTKVSSYHSSVLQNLGGGFLAVDLQGRTVLINPAAKKILSLSPDLPLNLPAAQVLQHVPEMSDILMQTVATRRTVKRQELRWKHEGAEHILGYSTLLLQDPDGNTSGAGITFQDITQFKG